MKNTLLVVIIGIATLATACKKSESDQSAPRTINTNFQFEKRNYYLGETVTVDLKGASDASYIIDFGDGTKSPAIGTNLAHAYSQGGNYQITLSSGDQKTTRNIRVYPGTTSYQFKNSLRVDIDSINSRCFKTTNKLAQLPAGTLSDTLYANVASTATGLDYYLGVKLKTNSVVVPTAYEQYTYRDIPNIYYNQHNIVIINEAMLVLVK